MALHLANLRDLMTNNLWLFDIDGTLVNINDAHLASYKLTYKDILGVDVSDQPIIDTFGMSEVEMHIKILQGLGLSYDKSLIDRIITARPLNFKEVLGSSKIEPLEGVADFLTYLKNNNEYLGAFTGNLEGPARFILSRSGLEEFFSILSYDDCTKSKQQIIKYAIGEAKQNGYNFGRVVVIGDTTKDIEAGKNIGAFTVGVATGSDPLGKLQRSKPDSAVTSLKFHKTILNKIR